jgi:hypothetical protein
MGKSSYGAVANDENDDDGIKNKMIMIFSEDDDAHCVE